MGGKNSPSVKVIGFNKQEIHTFSKLPSPKTSAYSTIKYTWII